MRRSLTTRLFGTVQLTRLAMAVGAVGDVWFTVLFTRESGIYPYLSVTKMPLWVALGLSAIIATGLFTFGASLNEGGALPRGTPHIGGKQFNITNNTLMFRSNS